MKHLQMVNPSLVNCISDETQNRMPGVNQYAESNPINNNAKYRGAIMPLYIFLFKRQLFRYCLMPDLHIDIGCR